jgi:general stress protein 26
MIDERIDRAKWLLSNIKHAAMATVNADGTPHNTPYLFMKNDDLSELYWGSHPQSLHSQNVARTGQLFVVLYEANERGGLYIKCKNGRIAAGAELKRALAAHNKLRQSWGQEPLPLSYYSGESGQSMYIANTETFWVNYAERDADGLVKEDKRQEVSCTDLLTA